MLSYIFSKNDVLEHPEGDGDYGWVQDFVYGGIDGAVTTFAVVAGVEGASLSVSVVLILGFANLFADGFSMSVGKYLSDKSQLEYFEKIKKIEFSHLKSKTENEVQEVRDILKKYNFKGKDLDRATEIVTSHPEGWVDLMMRNEFNMTHENTNPMMGALVTFASFVLIGFIPLLSYVFKPVFNFSDSLAFLMACVFTLFALFVVGIVKSKFSMKNWFLSGLETAIMGGLAAAISYYVGYLLTGLL